MDALTKAFTTLDRSYASAKLTVGKRTEDLFTSSSVGQPFGDSQKYASAQSQIAAFRSWVYSAVRPIANRIAAQPIRVRRLRRLRGLKAAKAKVEELNDHPILDLFSDPNDLMTTYQLKWCLTASLLLTGRAFLFVPEGSPPQGYFVPSSWIRGHEGAVGYEAWSVQPPGSGEVIKVPAARMVYFSIPDPGDPWGAISPVQCVAAAINNDADILRSQRAAFSRGMHPSHAIFVGRFGKTGSERPRLTESQRRQLIHTIRKHYAGTANTGEPFIIDGLIEDIRPISFSPEQMAWSEISRDVKSRILEAFGTSPYILGGAEPGSRAASAVAEEHFLRNVVNPLIKLMNGSLSEWLSPMFAAEDERLEVEIEEVRAVDVELNLKIAALLLQGGAIRPNEIREMFGLEPMPELDGHLSTPSAHASYGATTKLQDALAETVREQLADFTANELLESVAGGNGRYRHDLQ